MPRPSYSLARFPPFAFSFFPVFFPFRREKKAVETNEQKSIAEGFGTIEPSRHGTTIEEPRGDTRGRSRYRETSCAQAFVSYHITIPIWIWSPLQNSNSASTNYEIHSFLTLRSNYFFFFSLIQQQKNIHKIRRFQFYTWVRVKSIFFIIDRFSLVTRYRFSRSSNSLTD